MKKVSASSHEKRESKRRQRKREPKTRGAQAPLQLPRSAMRKKSGRAVCYHIESSSCRCELPAYARSAFRLCMRRAIPERQVARSLSHAEKSTAPPALGAALASAAHLLYAFQQSL